MSISAARVNLEYPACPICWSNRRRIRYAKFAQHKIVRCCDCSVHYLYPRLTEDAMNSIYANDSYFESGEAGYADVSYSMQERALRATFQRLLLNLQKRNLTNGSLLEVGCGYGYLLDEARPYFSYRAGTEFSRVGAQLASSRADRVFQGGLEQLPDHLKFNCVIATHVIEHIYRPLDFIRRLVHHVKPRGVVLLAAPDMNGLLRKVMGHRWPSFKMPEHVLYFDERTLSAAMREAGLTNLKTIPYPHAFPLKLIAAKLRMPFPAMLGNTNVWVPTTTVAVVGSLAS